MWLLLTDSRFGCILLFIGFPKGITFVTVVVVVVAAAVMLPPPITSFAKFAYRSSTSEGEDC